MATFSQQQAQEMFKKAQQQGVTADVFFRQAVAQGHVFEGLDTNKVLSEMSGVTQKPKKNVGEKIADVTGGKELAQGIGQSLALRENSKLLGQTQKEQFSIQEQLIKRINDKKKAGLDVSRLEGALADITEEINKTGENASELLNPNKLTNKQVVGDALQLATTAGGAKVAGAIAGKATQATGLIKGIAQGAKVGAVGGASVGALTGTSQALQQNKDAKGITKGAIVGGLTGAVVGGAIGGVSGGIAGTVKSIKTKGQTVESLVAPKETPKVREQALKEGRVTEAGLLKKSYIVPSKRDKQLAEAVKGYISPKKPITENIDSITSGVRNINTGVKTYVKENKVPFNTKQLRTQLNKGKEEMNLIFASDANAEKTYNAVMDEFVKHVAKKDTAGLLQARQEFDKIPAIKKLLDSQGLGENTRKEVVLTMRDMANRYIASLLPKGNQYRAQLLQESRMIEAIGNMAEKNIGMIGKNKLQLLTEQYPLLKWIVGAGVGAASVGVGGAIIGSSD